MRLSIISASYNSESTIREMLQSVAEQRFSDFELIIVDGGSTDHTLDIIREFKDQMNLQYISEPDEGVYDALNKGIKMARGQWLYFLGTDDSLFDSEVLREILAPNTIKDEVAVIYGNVFVPGQQKIVGREWGREDWVFENVCHQAIFYRRALFDKFGLYEPQYKVCADYVFNLKLLHAGVSWQYVDRIVANFSGEGMSSCVFDERFHEVKGAILYQPFAHLHKEKLYRAKQFYIYNEIRHKSLSKGILGLLKMMYYTGQYSYHLQNAFYWIRERIRASFKTI